LSGSFSWIDFLAERADFCSNSIVRLGEDIFGKGLGSLR
jgi:hypothetical protein